MTVPFVGFNVTTRRARHAAPPPKGVTVNDAAELDDLSRRILDFEQNHTLWTHAGSKDQAVREVFGLSSIRYHSRLNALLDDPRALAYAPAAVNRLRRLRERRTVRPARF